MVPPGWQLPSPGGSPAVSSLEAPSPTSAGGAELGKPVLGGFSLLPDLHAYWFSWPGLALPSWPLALPNSAPTAPHPVWGDHLPILNSICHLSPACSLGRRPTPSSPETIEANLPPSTVSVPPSLSLWQRYPPLILGLSPSVPSLTLWTLSGHSVCTPAYAAPSLADSSQQHLNTLRSLTTLKTHLLQPGLLHSVSVLSPPHPEPSVSCQPSQHSTMRPQLRSRPTFLWLMWPSSPA